MQNPTRFSLDQLEVSPLSTEHESLSREIVENLVSGAMLKTRLAARDDDTPDKLLKILFRNLEEFGQYAGASGRYQTDLIQRSADMILQAVHPAWRAVIPFYLSLLAQGARPPDFESRFAMFGQSSAPFFKEFEPTARAQFSGDWAQPSETAMRHVDDVRETMFHEVAEVVFPEKVFLGSWENPQTPIAAQNVSDFRDSRADEFLELRKSSPEVPQPSVARSHIAGIIGSVRKKMGAFVESVASGPLARRLKYALAGALISAPLLAAEPLAKVGAMPKTQAAVEHVDSLGLAFGSAAADASEEVEQQSPEQEENAAPPVLHELRVDRKGSLSESLRDFIHARVRTACEEKGVFISQRRLEKAFAKEFGAARIYDLVEASLASTPENEPLARRFARNRDFPVPPGLKFYVAEGTPAIDAAIARLVGRFERPRENLSPLERARKWLRRS